MQPNKYIHTMVSMSLIGTGSALTLNSAHACAPAPPMGRHVEIGEEAAIIVWDKATHTEHFTRRASFHSDAASFGFLVPTPTLPTLAQAEDEAFARLDRVMEPRVETQTRTRYDFRPLLLGRRAEVGAAMPGGAATDGAITSASAPHSTVRVLHSQQVGGYEATILEADDAGALNRWLGKHGYASRPALTHWLQPYVAAHWKITAFKVAADAAAHAQETEDASDTLLPAGNRVSSAFLPPVRMTFHADQPFYPYREPSAEGGDSNKRMSSRLLRVYYLGEERVQGGIRVPLNTKPELQSRTTEEQTWLGVVKWTDALPADQHDYLANELGLRSTELPQGLRLTTFDDRSSPRPAVGDLFFGHASNQSAVTPPPVIRWEENRVPLPADVLAVGSLFVLGMAGGARRRLRRARPPQPESTLRSS